MKRALVTLNIGGNSLHPKSRESFLNACDRWQCEFVEVTKPLAPVHPFFQKLKVYTLFSEPTHILQLDADMMIREDMPTPFEVDPDVMHVVPARAGYCLENVPRIIQGAWRRSCNVWIDHLAQNGIDCDMPDVIYHYLNAGFFLYGSHSFVEFYEDAWAVGESMGFPTEHYPEQGLLSVLLHNFDIATCWLPGIYNCTAWKKLGLAPMEAFIYHYAGKQEDERRELIDATDYSTPDDNRLPKQFLETPQDRIFTLHLPGT